ncbi:MAG: hypothetical protein K6T66_01560 [Peptococcaceae bacterium]|nr:hypothetical protein [Peptococcaceae bacterium]
MQKAARDMTMEQITHAFCTWCNYRRFVASSTYWGCGLEENKKEELCLHRKAVQKEEKAK